MQSRTASLFEQVVNWALGFLVAIGVLLWFVNPVFELGLSLSDSLRVNVMVFIFSVARGFILRRLFVSASPQSFMGSVCEKLLDTFIGFILMTFFWSLVVAPSFGLDESLVQSILINCIFLVVNFLRSLLVRRAFETITKIVDARRVLV